jgi:hypothetical protein
VSDSSNRAWDVAEIYGNANAALICQAVNSFDAMREALQAIISGACEHGLFAGESVDPEWYLAQAKAALKLAEGR